MSLILPIRKWCVLCLPLAVRFSYRMKPKISNNSAPPVVEVRVFDETGTARHIEIAGEYPLTLYVDGREIITLMTLGQMPEALAAGWLRNQRLLTQVSDIEEVLVDWEVQVAAVYTHHGIKDLPTKKTATSGCGQGSMFGDLLENLESTTVPHRQPLTAEVLFDLLAKVRERDTIYKTAGAVHACALATIKKDSCHIVQFVEDVGRHNAVDAIAGWMWLNDIRGDDKIFYTTGRLTSEMAVKCAQIGVPYLVSRSGATRMGLDIAQKTGLTMFARATNRRYLLLCGGEHFVA